MKNVQLLEATLDELGGVEPEPGSEVIYRDQRYRVVEVTPPVVKPPSKWRKAAKPATPKWRMLVEKLN